MLTMELYDPIPFVPPLRPTDIVAAARAVYEEMDTRRSVRTFSDEAVAREAIVYAIRAASTAPKNGRTTKGAVSLRSGARPSSRLAPIGQSRSWRPPHGSSSSSSNAMA